MGRKILKVSDIATLKALSNPVRMRILGLLRSGGKRTAGQISAQTGIALGAEVLLRLRCERQPSVSCTPMHRQRKLVKTKSAPREQNTPTTETRPATSEQYR